MLFPNVNDLYYGFCDLLCFFVCGACAAALMLGFIYILLLLPSRRVLLQDLASIVGPVVDSMLVHDAGRIISVPTANMRCCRRSLPQRRSVVYCDF